MTKIQGKQNKTKKQQQQQQTKSTIPIRLLKAHSIHFRTVISIRFGTTKFW